jgi:hypothetical protein
MLLCSRSKYVLPYTSSKGALMNKLIFASLIALSFIAPSLNGAALASKFKGLSSAKKVGLLGLTGSVGALVFSKLYAKPTIKINGYDESKYGIHYAVRVNQGSQKIGEADITDSCLVFKLSLNDKTNSKEFKKSLFNAVLQCASSCGCKTIENHGADQLLYAELKSHAEANSLPIS